MLVVSRKHITHVKEVCMYGQSCSVALMYVLLVVSSTYGVKELQVYLKDTIISAAKLLLILSTPICIAS